MEKNHLASAAGLVFNKENLILLVRHPARGWEFPGGLIEPGEGIIDALKREIYEESGVYVEVTGFVGVNKCIDKDIINIDFCCLYTDGELTASDESPEVGWFSREDAMSVVTNKMVKKRLEDMLAFDGAVRVFDFTALPFSLLSDNSFCCD